MYSSSCILYFIKESLLKKRNPNLEGESLCWWETIKCLGECLWYRKHMGVVDLIISVNNNKSWYWAQGAWNFSVVLWSQIPIPDSQPQRSHSSVSPRMAALIPLLCDRKGNEMPLPLRTMPPVHTPCQHLDKWSWPLAASLVPWPGHRLWVGKGLNSLGFTQAEC